MGLGLGLKSSGLELKFKILRILKGLRKRIYKGIMRDLQGRGGMGLKSKEGLLGFGLDKKGLEVSSL